MAATLVEIGYIRPKEQVKAGLYKNQDNAFLSQDYVLAYSGSREEILKN